jgi:hypothetical protein
MHRTAGPWFALVLGCGALACAASGELPDDGGSAGGTSGSSGTSAGSAGKAGSGGLASGGTSVGGSSGFTSGGTNTGGAGNGGATTGSGGASGSGTGGLGAGGSAAGAGNTAGSFSGGGGAGGNGGGGTGGSAAGAGNTGGTLPGGGGAGGATGGVGGANGGSSGGGAGGATGGTGGAFGEPDCNAQMPSGGTLRMNNGTGGEGNLAWEIWSNTGEGQLTTFSVPAFIATWNESGGYLGRLGYEWGGFQGNPVPHDQRGEIRAQFVSRKTGTAGGYSYIGMYGWTTSPCVEWYVVDDSYNMNMPINPGNTTNEGDIEVDGGTYVVYTRPTTGSGGTRCSGETNWIQYYSVRRSARACGVISLSEHFRQWESLGMDMGGELLEAKILVEVGGGVGNVELPIANVSVQ